MLITNILGSPRAESNGAAIAQSLIKAFGNGKHEVTTYPLAKLTYRGCQACMSCKKNAGGCVVKDDLSPVLEAIGKTDVVVLSSPVYFGEITSQAKGLVDRLYSFYKPDYRTNPDPSRLSKGKKLVFILPQGNADESAFADIVPKYVRIFSRLGFGGVYPIRALGVGIGSNALKNESVVQSVNETVAILLRDK
jgi:multimeric flavodoxin WrbA